MEFEDEFEELEEVEEEEEEEEELEKDFLEVDLPLLVARVAVEDVLPDPTRVVVSLA